MSERVFLNNRPAVPPVSERPVCPNCKRPLAVRFDSKPAWSVNPRYEGCYGHYYYVGTWKYEGFGHFCSQSCAAKWANREYKPKAGTLQKPCSAVRGEKFTLPGVNSH